MTLTSVFAKTTRDRWLGVAIGSGAIALWMLMGMAIYRDIDLSLYTDLPEYLRSLMGIPGGADVAALAFNVILGFAGAMTLASLALSMGAASVAGEERNGSFDLLMANPVSRTRVVISKAGSMAVLVGAASLVLFGAGLVVPVLLGVETGGMHLGAIIFHLFVNALFYGSLAMFVGAATGNRSRASGIAAGVMILSYFAVGILPLIGGASDLARIFPWYYFDSSDPINNGVAWGHIVLLGGLSLAMLAAAVTTLQRRDLKEHDVAGSLVDRLRSNPRTAKLFERLAGSTRVSRTWLKTLSEHQALLIITGYAMFLMMGVLLGPMYNAIDDTLITFSEKAPKVLLALVGNANLATPEGWYQTETFSMMAPIAAILVTAAIGAKAVAGEEERHTMGLLLANPISRTSVVVEKTIAMIVAMALVGFLTWLGVWLGSVVAGLGMSVVNIAAACVLFSLLGLVFGALALAIGAATGRVKTAVFGTVGVSLALYLVDTMFPLSDSLVRFADWTPFHFYLGNDPLTNGLAASDAAVLMLLFAALTGIAVFLFARRDVRLVG